MAFSTEVAEIPGDRPVEVLERCPETGRALTVTLPDGRMAFYQRRPDQCMQAALAALLQVHIEDVPDPRLDKHLAAGEDPDAVNQQAASELASYLSGFGCRLVRHAVPPADRGAWIGISPGAGRFDDHVVLMAGDRIAFDPASNWLCPPGTKVAPVTVIAGGLTLEPLGDE